MGEGSFLGIRIDGKLAAMAGERFRFPVHTETSGVRIHPDFRGRGLTRSLSAAVAANIVTRGDTPLSNKQRIRRRDNGRSERI